MEAGHKPSTGRAVLGLVILLLAEHRINEAEIVAREFGNNCAREQNVLIEDMLDAFDQNDTAKLQQAMKNKCLSALEPEFNPTLSALCLPPDTAELGIRARTRSRRNFSVDKAATPAAVPEPKKDDTTTTTSTSSSDNDEEKKKKKKKAATASVSFELKEGQEHNKDLSKEKEDEEHAGGDKQQQKEKKEEVKPSKIPGAKGGKKRNPLVKMKTHDAGSSLSTGQRKASFQKLKPSSYIDVTTDSIERHRPSNLPDPAVYVDVTGFDPVQPAYMGMTVEQWRAFKLQQMAGDEENEFGGDDAYGRGDDDGWN